MPNYNVIRLDDGQEWELPVPNIPNKEEALHLFNKTIARREGIGPFKFYDDDNNPVDYCLIEISALGHEKSYPLTPLSGS
jgi:hypothetical protein